MSKADDIVRRFQQTNDEIISTLEGVSEDKWNSQCRDEGRSINVVAHHVGSSHKPIAGLAVAIATGQAMPPLTREMIDQGNAAHAQQFADASKQETLDLLRSEAEASSSMIRGLSDDQLAKTASSPLFGGEMSSEQVLEAVWLGHPHGHLENIKSSL